MTLRLPAAAILLALSSLLACCGPEGTSGPPEPRPTTAAVSSPAQTPDARSVPVETLVARDAKVEKVLYGPVLPGGGEQIVVHSTRDIGCDDRQDYLQVFAYDRAFGEWRALFEADRWPSAASAFIPDREDSSNPCEGYEALDLVALADLEADEQSPELVLALSTSADDGGGDEPGPLLLTVLSFRTGAAESVYSETTTRGGAARFLPGDRIALEQGIYPPQSGPLWRGRCCPNATLAQVIGWDEQYGQIDVLERSLALYCRQGAIDEVNSDAIIVTCDADGGQRYTGYRLTEETRVLPVEFGGISELRVGQEVSVSVAEPLELDEDWELEPIATEVRVLNQQYARGEPPGAEDGPARLPDGQGQACGVSR